MNKGLACILAAFLLCDSAANIAYAISADALISPSIVLYELDPLNSNDTIEVIVTYEQPSLNSGIKDVILQPQTKKENGRYEYLFGTTDEPELKITFFYEKNLLVNVLVEDSREILNKNLDQTRYVLRSRAGYVIVFTFYREAGEVVTVQIYPEVHPTFDP